MALPGHMGSDAALHAIHLGDVRRNARLRQGVTALATQLVVHFRQPQCGAQLSVRRLLHADQHTAVVPVAARKALDLIELTNPSRAG